MSKFDPKPHIRKVQYTERKTGKVITREILDTGPRLAWFRSDHPIEEGWRILTTCVRLDENGAHYLAEIVNPEGMPIATGNRLVFAKDFENYNEKAETQAIGRALSVCGYGTLQALEPGDEDGEEEKPNGMPDAPARAMPAPTPVGVGMEMAQPITKVPAPIKHWIEYEKSRKAFWGWTRKSLALKDEDVHKALGVESVKEFQGSMAEAKKTIEEWLASQIDEEAEQGQ